MRRPFLGLMAAFAVTSAAAQTLDADPTITRDGELAKVAWNSLGVTVTIYNDALNITKINGRPDRASISRAFATGPAIACSGSMVFDRRTHEDEVSVVQKMEIEDTVILPNVQLREARNVFETARKTIQRLSDGETVTRIELEKAVMPAIKACIDRPAAAKPSYHIPIRNVG